MTWLLAVMVALSSTAAAAAGEPEQLQPPTGLKQRWLDAITVNISWKKPRGLPAEAATTYAITIANETTVIHHPQQHVTLNLYTQEIDSDHWKFEVKTVGENGMMSPPVSLNISPDKQKAELVKDFKCVVDVNRLNCSWIPADPSLNLTVHYRMCGRSEELVRSVKRCGETGSRGNPERHSCILQAERDTCIYVETHSAVSTFKPQLVLNPPLVKVTEENDTLRVTLTTPLQLSCMTFDVCYKRCNLQQECINTTGIVLDLPYEKTCRYEFQARTRTSERCFTPLVSQMSQPVIYGVNEAPVPILALVAVFAVIILSVCIILLCCCFRKHRDIIWPNIPDPSVIFKHMMNGNSELRTPGGNLYSLVPERICPLQIDTPT